MMAINAATPPIGVAALIGASDVSNEFAFLSRTIDAIREIGSAPDIENARRAAVSAALGFDVIVVALQDELVRLNERSVSLGIETLADIGVPVLMLTGFGLESEDDFALAATWLRKHVRGVLSIDASARELSAALRAVGAGHIVVEPRVSQAMLNSGARKRPTVTERSARAPGEAPPLSTREREVLALLAQGLATKNIAHELGISAHTVKAHVESIFAKFGATTRAEAVAIGVRRGAVML
jgi:DNA-binding NarL/FixJ family response regulator